MAQENDTARPDAENVIAERWGRLSDDELRGAEYALRLLHSSPAIKGRALEVLRAQIHDVHVVRSARLIETVGTPDA